MPVRFLSYILGVQGLYYLCTGIWPIADMASFIAVTGPKTDLWLVRTLGGVIAVCGAAAMIAASMRRLSIEIVVLALGLAGVLTIADIVSVLSGAVSPIYLADAAAEIALLGFWYYGYRAMPRSEEDVHHGEDAPLSGERLVH